MVRYVQAPRVLSRTVGVDVVLAPIGREDFDVLSGSAGAVWSLLAKPQSTSELVSLLEGLYDAPRETVAADVGALLADLVARGAVDMVTVVDA